MLEMTIIMRLLSETERGRENPGQEAGPDPVQSSVVHGQRGGTA